MTVLLVRTPGVVVLFLYVHSSTLFLQHPIGFQLVFFSKATLRLAFASALLICVFQVCLLSKVIPRYVALSVCCSSVSSNIIFMGFDFVDKVRSDVKYLVLFTLHTSLVPSLTRYLLLLGVAFWQLSHITPYGNFIKQLGLMSTSTPVIAAHFRYYISIMKSCACISYTSSVCVTLTDYILE